MTLRTRLLAINRHLIPPSIRLNRLWVALELKAYGTPEFYTTTVLAAVLHGYRIDNRLLIQGRRLYTYFGAPA